MSNREFALGLIRQWTNSGNADQDSDLNQALKILSQEVIVVGADAYRVVENWSNSDDIESVMVVDSVYPCIQVNEEPEDKIRHPDVTGIFERQKKRGKW